MVITVVMAVGLYAIVLATLLRCARVLYRRRHGEATRWPVGEAVAPAADGVGAERARAALFAENALLAELSAGRMGREEYRARMFELAQCGGALADRPEGWGIGGVAAGEAQAAGVDHPDRPGPGRRDS